MNHFIDTLIKPSTRFNMEIDMLPLDREVLHGHAIKEGFRNELIAQVFLRNGIHLF